MKILLKQGAGKGMHGILIPLLAVSGLAFAVTLVMHSAFSALSDGAQAENVLGQWDANVTTTIEPEYTKGAWNGGVGRLGFSNTQDVVLDSGNDRLYVADTNNSRVLVYNLNTNDTLIDRIPDNVLGQSDFNSNVSAVTQAAIKYPTALALDASNNRLFVADGSNNRVMVFDVASITDGENAVNVLGQADFTTSSFATTQSRLRSPGGLLYDGTNDALYVADSSNNRVMVFDVASITDGENAVNVLGQADFTSATAATTQSGMKQPYGLALDSVNNRLFVGEYGNRRVTTFDVASITDGENAVNVLGATDFTTANYSATQSTFRGAQGLAYDSANTFLYVADPTNRRVMVFDVASITDGENAVNVLGQYDSSVSPTAAPVPFYSKGGANNSPNSLAFRSLRDVLVDETNDRMYVADYTNNRVLVFELNSNHELVDKAADFVLGQPNLDSGANATTQSGMNNPTALAMDEAGDRLFVVEESNNRVLVFDVASITNGENAINVLGQPDFTSNGQTTSQSTLYVPYGAVYDANNDRLFVSDASPRVVVFDVSSITDGENAVNVLGQTNFTNQTSDTTATNLWWPYHIDYDHTNDRLFVTDADNWRLVIYDVASITDGEAAVNVLGAPDFTSYPGTLTADSMRGARGVAYDADGDRLFVADWNYDRVTVFDVASITDGEAATLVLGQTDFTTQGSGLTQSKFNNPYGMDYDTVSKKLYVVDEGNSRIMVFSDAAIASGGSSAASRSPSITFSAPNGGETFDANEHVHMFWGSNVAQYATLKISLSIDGGETYPYIVLETGSFGDGFASWDVPNLPTEEGRLKAELIGYGGVLASDISDQTFTIIGDPTIGETDHEDAFVPSDAYEYKPIIAQEAGQLVSIDDDKTTTFVAQHGCIAGWPFRSESSYAVHYCGQDGKAYTFPNSTTYLTWFDNFLRVIVMSDETVAEIPFGGWVTVRPGSLLVKIPSDPKVYAVADGGVLRHVPTEQAAIDLYGPLWASRVIDLNDTTFAHYTIGEPIQ